MFLFSTSEGLTWAGVNLDPARRFRGFLREPGVGVRCLYFSTSLLGVFCFLITLEADPGVFAPDLSSFSLLFWTGVEDAVAVSFRFLVDASAVLGSVSCLVSGFGVNLSVLILILGSAGVLTSGLGVFVVLFGFFDSALSSLAFGVFVSFLMAFLGDCLAALGSLFLVTGDSSSFWLTICWTTVVTRSFLSGVSSSKLNIRLGSSFNFNCFNLNLMSTNHAVHQKAD